MPMKPRGTTKSSNRKSMGNFPKEVPPGPVGKVSRAHRTDTPEARRQVERIPKTHPTRNVPSARKDSRAKSRSGRESGR